MKYKEILEQVLAEINMSPNSLKSLAADINAQAGMEFEMIVPNVGGSDDYESEPDYDQDERTSYFSNIEEFFSNEGYNSSREIAGTIESMQEEFYDWVEEKLEEDWQEEEFEAVYDWAKENASPEEIVKSLDLDDEDVITKDDLNRYTEYCIKEKNDIYDEAREDWFDRGRGDIDEYQWLRNNYPYMSDVQSNFDLSWPYWTDHDGGEIDIDTVADDFESAIGRKVNASRSYHGATREKNKYVIEPDGSLNPDNDNDSGLEFVSPPLPIGEMLTDLDKVVKWANRMGCYTNNSTGLHMNVSIPDLTTAKLDYVKLALLLGDEYVLDQFGRQSNTYTTSAMKIVRDRIRDRPEDAAAMLNQMKEHLSELATKIIHSGETSKYTSINTKGGYVEFRSPGGDWLSDYNDNPGKITNTLLRFVVALDAAADPEKYRNEYLKKLYAALSPKSENDTISYFAKYVAGEMPKAALKSFIKQAQLERNVKAGKTGGEEFKWQVSRPGYSAGIIVKAKSKEEAIDKALGPDGYPDWASARSQLIVKPIGPADTSSVKEPTTEPIPGSTLDLQRQRLQRTQGISQVGQTYEPAHNGEFTGQWLILDGNNRILYKFGGIGNSQNDANRHAMEWLRQNPENMRDGITVVPEIG